MNKHFTNHHKPIVFLILLFSSINGIGQSYVPFPEDSARWCFTYDVYDAGEYGWPWSSTTTGFYYSIVNDTVVHGKNYINLGLTQIWSYWNGTYSSGESNSDNYLGLVGCFREEDKKIFFYKYAAPEYSPLWYFGHLEIPDSTEIILYDFGLNVGESVIQHTWYSSDSLRTVIAIDSILINDGTYRKLFNTELEGNYQSWIEGIGADEGLFMPYISEFEWYDYTLNCFWNKHQYLFGDDSCDYVEFTIDIQDPDSVKSISVYPNPFKTEFIISNLSSAGLYKISVINYAGEECLNQNVVGPSCIINTGALSSGIYILFIQSDHEMNSRKIIKL